MNSGESTKERIIRAAIDLFNRDGVRSVTTNHIARELHISPGNLYYHFKNKEEIIRAIIGKMTLDGQAIFRSAPDDHPTIDSVKDAMERTFQLEYRYRFFYRELISLIRSDREIHRRYRDIRERKLREIATFVKRFSDAGYLAAEDHTVYDRLIRTGWMIYNYWLVESDLENIPISRKYIKDGIVHIFDLFEPYMNEEGLTYYRRLKTQWRDE